MNNTCSLAFFSLAALACLLPVSANAQTYYQSQPFLPVESHAVVGTPLSFSQADTYSSPPAYSQPHAYSQPLIYAQPNMYSQSQPLTFEQANQYTPLSNYAPPSTYPQLGITLVGGLSSGIHSSISPDPVEIATPQAPAVSSPPIESHSAIQPRTAGCST